MVTCIVICLDNKLTQKRDFFFFLIGNENGLNVSVTPFVGGHRKGRMLAGMNTCLSPSEEEPGLKKTAISFN